MSVGAAFFGLPAFLGGILLADNDRMSGLARCGGNGSRTAAQHAKHDESAYVRDAASYVWCAYGDVTCVFLQYEAAVCHD